MISVLSLGIAPFSARAAEREQRGDITITWAGELDRAHGIRSGSGTHHDPYVISGWEVGNISIRDTEAAILITDNTITGTLRLNWVGPMIEVQGNDIGDLRVNENIARWGDNTGGAIVHNTFRQVGQLRHFDGRFAFNTVGAPDGSTSPDTRAVNFDGFNGARFEHNTIFGYVDARLHGHHHASSFRKQSHAHAAGEQAADHARRFHRVTIRNNEIFSSHDYALAYLDTNHAANDRTADSETNPYLNAPHVHFTRADLVRNVLSGAGLLVNVFNARDERHDGDPRGRLRIVGNRVTLDQDLLHPFRERNGIELRQARNVHVRIAGNRVQGPAPLAEIARPLLSEGAGIALTGLDRASVLVADNSVTDRQYGVQASSLTGSVRWAVVRLATSGVEEPVAYDESVQNRPARA